MCFIKRKELKSVFGTNSVDYYSKLETIDRAYYFIKFGKSNYNYREVFEEKETGIQ